MAENVTLSAAVRTSLLSLQGTTKLIDRTQQRLSTGLEVGGPVDDAVAFFQSKGLSDRATDFSEKKSNIDQGISSLSSAIQGINGVESLVRQLKGLALNAKSATSETIGGIVSQFNDLRNQINYLTSDSAYQGLNLINGTGSTLSVDFSNVTSSVLSVASVDITVGINGLDIRRAITSNGGFNLAFTGNTGSTLYKQNVIETQFAATGQTFSACSYTVSYGGEDITFTVGTAGANTTSLTNTESFTVGDTIYVRRATSTATIQPRDVATRAEYDLDLEFARNTNWTVASGGTFSVNWAGTGNTLSAGSYTFSAAGYGLTITVGSAGATTTSFTNTEYFSTTEAAFNLTFASGGASGGTAAGYVAVAALTAGTNSATGINNEGRYIVTDSSITSVRVGHLGGLSGFEIGAVTGQYVVDSGIVDQINALVLKLDEGLNTLRSRAQTLGSNVALLQTRLDFTTNYVNILTEGAGKLTLADLNEEGANLLALQTRQQLGIQALSFAGQAEQSILTLFR